MSYNHPKAVYIRQLLYHKKHTIFFLRQNKYTWYYFYTKIADVKLFATIHKPAKGTCRKYSWIRFIPA